MKARRELLSWALVAALSMTLFIGCGKKDDAITQAEKKDKDKPDIAETKAIAEEGFIYGLPIVMNYAVQYEFVVDRRPASSRRRSTRFTTSTASRPTRTRQWCRRTATRLTRCSGWTCVPKPW